MEGKKIRGRKISESEVGKIFLPQIFLPLTPAQFTQRQRLSGGDSGRFDFWQRNGEQGNVSEGFIPLPIFACPCCRSVGFTAGAARRRPDFYHGILRIHGSQSQKQESDSDSVYSVFSVVKLQRLNG